MSTVNKHYVTSNVDSTLKWGLSFMFAEWPTVLAGRQLTRRRGGFSGN